MAIPNETIDDKERVKFEYDELFKKYGFNLTKLQTAWYLGISERTFHENIKEGRCPLYYRTSEGSRSELRFKTYDVVVYSLSILGR